MITTTITIEKNTSPRRNERPSPSPPSSDPERKEESKRRKGGGLMSGGDVLQLETQFFALALEFCKTIALGSGEGRRRGNGSAG